MIGTEVKQYRITRQLGHGGMGDVYQARDLELDRDVAVKCMRPDLMEYDEITERFRTEARTLASVRHPNIATVHRFFEHDGALFLVMEFIPGKPFDEIIAEGVPSPDQSVRLVQQALRGLGHAHEHNVVHRDIKPANLMLDGHGTVKVLDFGIAHIVGQSTLTGTGMMLGTPGYMAPEQVLGQKVDRRTDLYAMGIVLYQMLTGKLPFVGNSQFEAQQAHFQERPKQLELLAGSVAPALHDAVLHAIAKESDDRFQTANEFSDALGQTLNGISSARPTIARVEDATVVRDPNTGATLPAGTATASSGSRKWLVGSLATLALAAGAAALYLKPWETKTDLPTPQQTAGSEPRVRANSGMAASAGGGGSIPVAGSSEAATPGGPSGAAGAPVVAKSADLEPPGPVPSDPEPSDRGAAPTSTATTAAVPASAGAGAVAAIPSAIPPAPAVPSGPPTVAVVDFTSSSPTAYRASLAELVTDELVNRSKFDVLEREKLATLTGELSFQNDSGFVSPTSAVQMGNMLGARLLVTGHVIDHGTARQNYSGYGISTSKITSRLKARLEVIDLSTGAKLFSRVSQASNETQVVQGSRSDSSQKDLGVKVAKNLVTAMLAAPRLKELVEGPKLVAVAVNSTPPDADVEVDGTYYGTTGQPIELLPGTHQIRVSLPGYTDWEKRVLVKEGTRLMARLQKVDITRTETSVRIETN